MARIIKPIRITKHLKYLDPMKLYKLAHDTGKNMISCDLGEGKSGIVLHLHGSLKVLPFRSSDPLKEPFLVLRHDQMNPAQIATKLSELADHYDAAGFYMGFPADSRYMQNPNNGRGVKEALLDINQTGILAGKIITFVNEKNSSKKAIRKLKEYNPNLRKSYLKQFFQCTFAAKSFTMDFLIKVESGTLYDDEENELTEDYLEWVAKGMGF
ncbi:hypothetical protein Q3G72_009965 [Acer saccharum]|nr:hypothetical protein Q3G72_009965 [Acer saccharum]